MSRFYVPKEFVKDNKIYISGKEAHHILDVMRLKVSDEVVVFDGTGAEYVGVVKEAGYKSLLLEIIQTRRIKDQGSHSITLIQAIPKKEKMDHIIEKATELGAVGIIPVMTVRTIPEWNAAKQGQMAERWRKISLEAAKQCGRTELPVISPIASLEDAIRSIDGYNLKLMAALSDGAVKLKDALKNCAAGKIAVAIGPEGDFTLNEIDNAKEHGFKIVNLGPLTLKSDTAGLAVLAMINYEHTS